MRIIMIGLTISALILIAGFIYEYEVALPNNVSYEDMIPSAQKQIDCLSENIYYEAGSESTDGKFAVAMVTLNRVYSNKFKDTICSVVKQRDDRVCQFTWFCQKKSRQINNSIYKESQNVALVVYLNYENLYDNTKGATFYHADYVNPRWKKLEKTTKIGKHIFYKPKELEGTYAKQTGSIIKRKDGYRPSVVLSTNGRYFAPIM